MERMIKDVMTDEEVEVEIARLLVSDAVKLAKKENNIKNKRRQYMYSLRCMEKRGRSLMGQGLTLESSEDEFINA